MATVYLARQTDLDRLVALKELARLHAADEAFAERFLRESRMAGSLSHPNIVTVHDYFEHEGTPYISMEYIERGSLRPLVGKLTLRAGLRRARGAAGRAPARGEPRDRPPRHEARERDGHRRRAASRSPTSGSAARSTRPQRLALPHRDRARRSARPPTWRPSRRWPRRSGRGPTSTRSASWPTRWCSGDVPFSDSDTPMAMLVRHVSEPIPPPSTDRPDDRPAARRVDRVAAEEGPEGAPGDRARTAWDKLEEIVIHLLGPRWRREARLPEVGAHADERRSR